VFIPATNKEIEEKGWQALDVILVTGDAYIDSPFIGISVIGHVLMEAGFRVAIISQPTINSKNDISQFGEPLLFWGVSAGSVDSMVSNYKATRQKRLHDDFSPGGENNKRPDRATIVYVNLIRQYFKNSVPIVIGGIEASLRRVAHYDYWDNKIRRSILLDSRADFLLYGMAEKSILEIAILLSQNKSIRDVRGICYLASEPSKDFIILPSYEKCLENKDVFSDMFKIFYSNNDPLLAQGMTQQYKEKFLIHNPPQYQLTSEELDRIYEMPYEREVHPSVSKSGEVRAINTIRFSVTTHRGCFGECNFCSIAIHQGRSIVSRNEQSIIREIKSFNEHKNFKGIINDIGGPSANMYGMNCKKMDTKGACANKRCMTPNLCVTLNSSHKRLYLLLKQINSLDFVKKAFVASGIRYDLILNDKEWGEKYFSLVMKKNISGILKIAPEHTNNKILEMMGKPGSDYLFRFFKMFNSVKKRYSLKLLLSYYFIAAYPGCKLEDMEEIKKYKNFPTKIHRENFLIFTPTPSTPATLMYYTELDYKTGKKIFVEKEMGKKEKQKNIFSKYTKYKKKKNGK